MTFISATGMHYEDGYRQAIQDHEWIRDQVDGLKVALQERIDELNAEGEAFNKECWTTLKALLELCEGFNWDDHSNEVTANSAFDFLAEELRQGGRTKES